ncbi:MAG: HD domain-containing protein, partial [Ktedonobacterales bacterium]
SKFNGGNEELGPAVAGDFLRSITASEPVVEHVQQIIRHISFKSGFDKNTFRSIELDIVQDADRLDAIGAIGIARAFAFGGSRGRALYDPDEAPQQYSSKEAYKASSKSTITHFHEKLLLLRDRMNTAYARRLAEQRHRYMEAFLDEFEREWSGEA